MDNVIPIFDGHNDTLARLYSSDDAEDRRFWQTGKTGHLDLPRGQAGGFAGGLFAIFIDSPGEDKLEKLDKTYAQHETQTVMAGLKDIEANCQGKFKQVYTVDDVRSAIGAGVMAASLHFEGAEAIEPDLSNLEGYYQQGLRSLGVTWSRDNAFGCGVNFQFGNSPDAGDGLTAAGVELVNECNKLGIMLDVSHLNEKGFWDVARTSRKPLVATHSCVYELCPSPRNLTNHQLDEIAETDGVVGINFAVAFLRPDGERNTDAPIDLIVDHIEFIAERIGPEHVALGSDFDGTDIPADLRDASDLPKVVRIMESRGFPKQNILNICCDNWLRVLQKTWTPQ